MFFAMLDLPAEARVNVAHAVHLAAGRARSQVDMGFYADPLSITWILLVTGVGSLIHLYSIGYMHGDPRFSRFFAYLNLFAASMLDPRARPTASSSRSSGGRASASARTCSCRSGSSATRPRSRARRRSSPTASATSGSCSRCS